MESLRDTPPSAASSAIGGTKPHAISVAGCGSQLQVRSRPRAEGDPGSPGDPRGTTDAPPPCQAPGVAQRRTERKHFRQRLDLMYLEKMRKETLEDLGADPYVD